jgi:hypothetical protein
MRSSSASASSCCSPRLPVQAGARHDDRPLGVAQQRRGALDALGGRARPRLRAARRASTSGRLHEDVVEREVDERRARVRA